MNRLRYALIPLAVGLSLLIGIVLVRTLPRDALPAAMIAQTLLPTFLLVILVKRYTRSQGYRAFVSWAALANLLVVGIVAGREIIRLDQYRAAGAPLASVLHGFDKPTALGLALSAVAFVFFIRQLIRGSQTTARGSRINERSDKTHHGSSDFMSMSEAAKMFPAGLGICIGEAYRPDRDDQAGPVFDPKDRSTWGKGGKAPLLCYNGDFGSTHGMIFAGSGSYKTTGLAIPTALTWPSSMVVLDPAREIGPMVAEHREARFGKRAVMLDPGNPEFGFDALAWIDRAASKEQAIADTANWLAADMAPGGGANTEFFQEMGTQLITAILGHLMLDKDVPIEHRTLARLRQEIASPEPKLKKKLQKIHENTDSSFVEQAIGPFIHMAEQTFSGVYATASKDTQWLSFPNFAKLVSTPRNDISQLTKGGIDVYINIELKDLRNHPGLARVIVGSLLNEVIEADGNIEDRVLFLLDEAVTVGRMKSIEVARDQGRKYGITLMMIYQAAGQLKDVWGRNAMSSWAESTTYRIYAGVNDIGTAEELSKAIGSYTTKVETRNSSKSSSVRGFSTTTAGSNKSTNTSYVKKDLMSPADILSNMRLDEQFVFVTGRPPLRCGRPIFFRRPEMVASVKENRFESRATSRQREGA